MTTPKVILDSVDRSTTVWTAITSEGTVHWQRYNADIAASGHTPICEQCNATLDDGELYWLCMDGGDEVCEDCVLFSTVTRKCPECLDEMHFCDDGEDGEHEKKIYSCNNQECPTEIVDIFRYKE